MVVVYTPEVITVVPLVIVCPDKVKGEIVGEVAALTVVIPVEVIMIVCSPSQLVMVVQLFDDKPVTLLLVIVTVNVDVKWDLVEVEEVNATKEKSIFDCPVEEVALNEEESGAFVTVTNFVFMHSPV